MKLKVCGITSADQLRGLAELKIDFAGLIFVESSPRFALPKPGDDVEAIRQCNIRKVGVFVNEEMHNIRSLIEEFGLQAVQLHGDEDPSYAEALNMEIPVIKAFRLSGAEDVERLTKPYTGSATYFLFDTLSRNAYGGTGQRFDWTQLQNAKIDKPFFLSGGISPEHSEDVRSFQHPALFAVDINSRFETAPGIKDLPLVQQFKISIQSQADPYHG